jgi:hypothetical protein
MKAADIRQQNPGSTSARVTLSHTNYVETWIGVNGGDDQDEYSVATLVRVGRQGGGMREFAIADPDVALALGSLLVQAGLRMKEMDR